MGNLAKYENAVRDLLVAVDTENEEAIKKAVEALRELYEDTYERQVTA
jgi:hypothetical protein